MTSAYPNVAILTAEQRRALLALRAYFKSDAPARWQEFARAASTILGVRALLVRRSDETWVTLADSDSQQESPALTALIGKLAETSVQTVRSATLNGRDWTLVRLPDVSGQPLMLVVGGDWTLSASAFTQLSRGRRAKRMRRRASAAALRLTHALGAAGGPLSVCQLALECAVRTVPSRLAAFAIPQSPDSDELSIVATHGYPAALVRDIRVKPGSGVIGTVFRDRVPLKVDDVTRMPELWRRRTRYRTNSFVAIPVSAGDTVMGVVCLADRLDDRPYARTDVAALKQVLAPAGLALAREVARQQAEAYARAASIDPLSGVFNRRYFHRRRQEELERALRQNSSVALLLLDIDDFKQINDRFGHPAGDDAIRAVADILKTSVRLFDICSRYGGEEFAILMPGAQAADAARIAERIRQQIENYRFVTPAMSDLRVTVSIGLTASREGSDRQLIEAADSALYQAKRDGKNRVRSSATVTSKSSELKNSERGRNT